MYEKGYFNINGSILDVGNLFVIFNWYINFSATSVVNFFSKGLRTVLMNDCLLKWPEKSFKENDIFSMKKIVGSTPELSAKVFLSLDKYQLKNMG